MPKQEPIIIVGDKTRDAVKRRFALRTLTADNTNSILKNIGLRLDEGQKALQMTFQKELNSISALMLRQVQQQEKINDLLAKLSTITPQPQILNQPMNNELLVQILAELKSEVDEGLSITYTGTATTTLKKIDVRKDGEPYHSVKGIIFKNTGSTTIKFAINTGALAYRRSVDAGDSYRRSHVKGRPIHTFFIQTDSSSSTYELEVLW